ncbi:Acetyltransferase (GNAT) family protein [Streptomyces sp. WMMB 322]|nr:Acetyltransferase (GNAT) family protein [Streptomyces sp. WMMB 322]
MGDVNTQHTGTMFVVEPLTEAHAEEVLAIYQAGIDEGNATFETAAPTWEAFDAAKLPGHRFVAVERDAGPARGGSGSTAVSDGETGSDGSAAGGSCGGTGAGTADTGPGTGPGTGTDTHADTGARTSPDTSLGTRADTSPGPRNDRGSVLGWIAVAPVSARAVYAGVVEHSVYVHPRARGRGVARVLLDSLIASTEAAGIWTVQAGIFPENKASIALHLRAGFRVVGTSERVARHHGVWRDVRLLERRSPVVE